MVYLSPTRISAANAVSDENGFVPYAFWIMDTVRETPPAHGRTMKFLHGLTADHVHRIAGVTSRTSVPETAVNFVRGVRFLMVPVEQIGADTFLAAVTRVLNMNLTLLGRVRQPFMGKQRLIVLGAISHGWNDSDRIFGKVVGAIHEMTGRGDGERSERIDVRDVDKQLAKLHAAPAENIDIGTAVREDFFLKIKYVITLHH